MDAFMSILRIIHIGGAILWCGAVFMSVAFLMPAAKAMGPEGGKFMRQLFATNKYPVVINAIAGLSVLSGLILYDKVSVHFKMAWITSGYGMMITIGGIAAIIALLYASIVIRPKASRLVVLGGEIEAGGAPPSPEQQAELGKLQAGMGMAMQVLAGMLAISVVCMAVARYTYL